LALAAKQAGKSSPKARYSTCFSKACTNNFFYLAISTFAVQICYTKFFCFIRTRRINLSKNLSDLNKKDRNKRHSSPFINVVKGVFFVVRVTLVPVSYLSAPSTVHSYRVPGKFIRTSFPTFFDIAG
jgi:hypothetical protein